MLSNFYFIDWFSFSPCEITHWEGWKEYIISSIYGAFGKYREVFKY